MDMCNRNAADALAALALPLGLRGVASHATYKALVALLGRLRPASSETLTHIALPSARLERCVPLQGVLRVARGPFAVSLLASAMRQGSFILDRTAKSTLGPNTGRNAREPAAKPCEPIQASWRQSALLPHLCVAMHRACARTGLAASTAMRSPTLLRQQAMSSSWRPQHTSQRQ